MKKIVAKKQKRHVRPLRSATSSVASSIRSRTLIHTNYILTFGLTVLMVAVLTVFAFNMLSGTALANYTLKPFWSTPFTLSANGGLSGGWGGPVQNTSTSRLYGYIDEPGAGFQVSPRVIRINDDRTGAIANRLENPLPATGAAFNTEEFISDGLDGAYVSWTRFTGGNDYLHYFQRASSSGAGVWTSGGVPWARQIGQSPSYKQVHTAASSDGDLLVAYPDGPAGTDAICAMKLNRTNGTSRWAASGTCNGGRQFASESIAGTLTVMAVTSDGAGGMVIMYTGNGGINITRVDGVTGNATWPMVTIPDTRLEQSAALFYNDAVYFVMVDLTNNEVQLDKILVSDGTRPWAQPVTVGTTTIGAAALPNIKLVQSGDSEISAVWKPSAGSRLLMNRVDLDSAAARWPAAVEVTDRFTGGWYYTFKGSTNEAYVVWCRLAGAEQCSGQEAQALNGLGQKLFGSDGAVLSGVEDEGGLGPHWRTSGAITEFCIDQEVRFGGQMYCIGNNPEITTPICSLDDGQNFGLCDEAQYGETLSHVRVDCTENPALPPAEGALAGETGQTEERALMDGRYVAYERAAPGSNEREIYLYDLGADQLFGSGDDHEGTYQVTSEPLNVKVWLDDINNNRILYSASNKLKIYNLDTGSLDPGTLNTIDAFGAGLDGRTLVYKTEDLHLAQLDIGEDGQLGTGDDLPETEYITIGLPADGRVRVSGRYAIYPDTSDPAQISLLDLNDQVEYAFTTDPSIQATEPWIDGRYIVWTDYRNDADQQFGAAPNNGDIFLFDMGPDEIYGTADDIGEVQISGSAKQEYGPRISGTKIIWTRMINEGAAGWNLNQEVFTYDLGPDGQFGTGDDVGPSQLTDAEHSQVAQSSDGSNTVWASNRLAVDDNDLIVNPVYIDPAPITEVSFTLSSPTGQGYTNRIVNTPAGTTYTHAQPVLIGESGQWTLTAVCRDNAGGAATSQAVWDVGPWYFSAKTKLPVYDGVIQISESNGDTMEVGNAGRDLASTGQIFIRPGNSLASAAWSGLAGAARQRLHFAVGLNGQPTIIVRGTGTQGVADGANGLAGFFTGAANDAGGSGIYADVVSCDEANGCSALNLNGGGQTGLYARSDSATQPAVKTQNDLGGNPTNNVSAALAGSVEVTGNVTAGDLTSPNCTPVTIGIGDTICPGNGFVRGYDETVDGQPDQIYCCGQ